MLGHHIPGDAELPESAFAHVLDGPRFSLFAPPRMPIDHCEYAIGLQAARLIDDGGTLQIGIGEEGDALSKALILRHHENARFCEAADHDFTSVS